MNTGMNSGSRRISPLSMYPVTQRYCNRVVLGDWIHTHRAYAPATRTHPSVHQVWCRASTSSTPMHYGTTKKNHAVIMLSCVYFPVKMITPSDANLWYKSPNTSVETWNTHIWSKDLITHYWRRFGEPVCFDLLSFVVLFLRFNCICILWIE